MRSLMKVSGSASKRNYKPGSNIVMSSLNRRPLVRWQCCLHCSRLKQHTRKRRTRTRAQLWNAMAASKSNKKSQPRWMVSFPCSLALLHARTRSQNAQNNVHQAPCSLHPPLRATAFGPKQDAPVFHNCYFVSLTKRLPNPCASSQIQQKKISSVNLVSIERKKWIELPQTIARTWHMIGKSEIKFNWFVLTDNDKEMTTKGKRKKQKWKRSCEQIELCAAKNGNCYRKKYSFARCTTPSCGFCRLWSCVVVAIGTTAVDSVIVVVSSIICAGERYVLLSMVRIDGGGGLSAVLQRLTECNWCKDGNLSVHATTPTRKSVSLRLPSVYAHQNTRTPSLWL